MVRRINTPGAGRKPSTRVHDGRRRRRGARVKAVRGRSRTIAVFGGDGTCLRAVLRRWTGRAVAEGASAGETGIATGGASGGQRIAVLHRPGGVLTPWPGGPLVWLFPERGPSETELAQLRQTLVANRAEGFPRLVIVICLPDDLTPEQAAGDLATIGDTLGVGLPEELDCSLQAVWFDDTREPCLRGLLKELEDSP